MIHLARTRLKLKSTKKQWTNFQVPSFNFLRNSIKFILIQKAPLEKELMNKLNNSWITANNSIIIILILKNLIWMRFFQKYQKKWLNTKEKNLHLSKTFNLEERETNLRKNSWTTNKERSWLQDTGLLLTKTFMMISIGSRKLTH